MNRLIIIGNGFDLAHGLPTGYCDFINWFWKDFKLKYKKPIYKNVLEFNETFYKIFDYGEIKCYRDLKNNLAKYAKDYKYRLNDFEDLPAISFQVNQPRVEHKSIITFKNMFLKKISNKHYIQNWVDIENEYYRLLKLCLEEENNLKVKKLNEEFEQIKKLLEEYLTTEVEGKFELNINREIDDIITKTGYLNNEIATFLKEVSSSEIPAIQRSINNQNANINRHRYSINKIYSLNFNYTSLVKNLMVLLDNDKFKYNQIHGLLNNEHNPIVFGFGDEMDDDYKRIEKKDDNEYLRNIKSFSYLNTPNYKNLIDFLEEDKFQIYIMGHSCGLSDRILLNKVFEHHNCISIKIYYYQNEKGDNYTDIAQNISRHFNKKEMMRERIVNKTYCKPLPQTQLPLRD